MTEATESKMRLKDVIVSRTREELQNGGTAQELIATIDAAPTSIIHIAGYVSKTTGELSNVFAIKGANYANTVQKSLAELAEMEADPELSLTVHWDEWVNAETGKKTTAACKNKRLEHRKLVLEQGDERLLAGFVKVRKSLENPEKPTVEYKKEGHGVYSHNDVLYIRDCRVLQKVVIEEGEDKVRTSSEAVAVANAIRRSLAVSKYREYRLDGRYDSISVGGDVIQPTDPDAIESTVTEKDAVPVD